MSVSNNFPTIRPSLSLDFANTKTLDPRITFTRSTTATCYDGVTTAKAEENLLTYSQDFDNADWYKDGASITANTTVAPDGTATADTLTGSGVSAAHMVRRASGNASSVGYTVSVYAKAGTNNFMQIAWAVDGSIYANFDLSGGTTGTTGGSGVTTSIVSVGNGWYRCVMTVTSTTATYPYFLLATSASDTRLQANTLATTIYLWGAQVEQRSSVTSYTPTTTQPITNYIPVLQTAAANVARFDHDPVTGESLGLLIEEQRTNLLTYSEQFDNAAWTKTRTSVTSNTTVAPDGTLTADQLVEDTTASSTHEIHYALANFSPDTARVFSFYAKAAGRSVINTAASSGAIALANASFDLTAVTATGAQALSIEPVGNGWFRCAVSVVRVSNNPHNLIIRLNNGGGTSYTGDGYSGVFLWGAQLEAGSFPTSYIPTTSAAVTRTADAASMTGENFSSWYRADEGTLFAEADTSTTNSSWSDIATLYAASSTFIQLGFRSGYQAYVANLSAAQVTLGSNNVTPNVFYKTAFTYNNNDSALSFGGSAAVTDTNCVLPEAIQLNIGRYNTSEYLNGAIKKLAYYPQRLSNTQLQALTA